MINGLRMKLENHIFYNNYKIKYLVVTLTKQVKDLSEKNFKSLKKEFRKI